MRDGVAVRRPRGSPTRGGGRERNAPGIPAEVSTPSRQNGRPPGTSDGRQSAREAYYKAQTRKLDLEHRRRLGELVEVTMVDRRWASMTLAMRERVLAIPTTARQRGIADAAGEEALRLLVEQALAELAERAVS